MKLYRQIRLREYSPGIVLYLFQDGRWELGLVFDTNGDPLLCINLIFIHLEIEFTRSKSFRDN